ncbi:hypothetical protein OPV22_023898 [Ensete ventricosum]|uniref:Uncharacterized protein n=1 Tax=Ensete ventricosum TaxID=4639 RepID=A0AAV8PD92_ENSVE|nr:hypothetical protein OPV22_023898 [Ensete ventricosum]
MAFYFVLSIPFLERDSGGGGASSENKARDDARLEAVVRAMELGYAGVCPFREVLSDADRGKIAPHPSLLPPQGRLRCLQPRSPRGRLPRLPLPPVHPLDYPRRCPQRQRSAEDPRPRFPTPFEPGRHDIQRGLYFEITDTHLIADAHVRRQILSDAKEEEIIKKDYPILLILCLVRVWLTLSILFKKKLFKPKKNDEICKVSDQKLI